MQKRKRTQYSTLGAETGSTQRADALLMGYPVPTINYTKSSVT